MKWYLRFFTIVVGGLIVVFCIASAHVTLYYKQQAATATNITTAIEKEKTARNIALGEYFQYVFLILFTPIALYVAKKLLKRLIPNIALLTFVGEYCIMAYS